MNTRARTHTHTHMCTNTFSHLCTSPGTGIVHTHQHFAQNHFIIPDHTNQLNTYPSQENTTRKTDSRQDTGKIHYTQLTAMQGAFDKRTFLQITRSFHSLKEHAPAEYVAGPSLRAPRKKKMCLVQLHVQTRLLTNKTPADEPSRLKSPTADDRSRSKSPTG